MNTRRRILAGLLATSAIASLASLFVTPPASAAGKPRWVYVGKELFTVNGSTSTVATYVNTNSIEGSRFDTFTITFQARYAGRKGINRVNVGVIVDCENSDAYADQFYVYYSPGSSDFERTDGGEISQRVRNRALSYCR
jgi:hypothetical protein